MPKRNFDPNTAVLRASSGSCRLFGPQNHDYIYFLEPKQDENGCVSKYMVTASPAVPGKTGHHYFSMDETGTIHYEQMRPVNAQSRVLQ